MTGLPFPLNGMSGLCSRILRIKDVRRDSLPSEPWAAVAMSAQAKRVRIFEEARSAVLDRIRQTR